MKILKKYLSFVLIFTMITVSIGFSATYADEISDKQNELEEINDKKEDAESELGRIAEDIEAKQNEIDELNDNIEEAKQKIKSTEEELESKKLEVEERQEGIDSRIRTMYKNGTVGFLDIIFSSSSVSNFLSNVEMIQHIYKYDKDVLNQLEEDYEVIEGIKTELEITKSKLDTEKTTAESKKAELKESKKSLEEQVDKLNEDAQGLNSEIIRLQKEAQEKIDDVVNGGGSDPSAQGMVWPTTTRWITSYYGWRIHPVLGYSKFHSGIDVGVGSGNPIYAAKSGVVILSQYYYGYGNAVIIDHGDGLSTLYAHLSSLNVSKGQWVEQGQVVARSGNTGISTGPHLHFEVRVNGSTVDPLLYY
ncbi:MAG TPA: peptidoglycan DD-metalloendopeptidase family protein [Anaerovoracaceae bacterium]|nr:peptidoglycan DD-metalloendopeptidase family protein [Anaerovoracaceae bacterium]